MSDILLFHVPKPGNFYQPIGAYSFILYHPIGYLGMADYARRQGLGVRIVDLGVERAKYGRVDIAALVQGERPCLVGVGLHWHFQSHEAIETARRIKASAPGVPIVLGGFTASFFCHEIMATFNFVDFVIRGDGEVPLVELTKCIEEGRSVEGVPNLVYRRADGSIGTNPQSYIADSAMLNGMSFTDFSFIKDRREYIDSLAAWMRLEGRSARIHRVLFGRRRTYPVLLGRGCANNCSFCGGGSISQKLINNRDRLAVRSADAVAASLRDIERWGFEGASLNWDALPAAESDRFFLQLFSLLWDPPLHLDVEIERWSLPTEEFLVAFKRTFTARSWVSLSLNHPNQGMRRRNDLDFYDTAALEQALGMFERLQVRCVLFLACGLPFENEKTLRQLKAYERSVTLRYSYTTTRVCIIEIEPCSPLSRDPMRYGVVPERSTFADYYRYHSVKGRNHYQEMGYVGSTTVDVEHLRRYYCRHFCRHFKLGSFSPLVCRAVGIGWRTRLLPLLDQVMWGRKERAWRSAT